MIVGVNQSFGGLKRDRSGRCQTVRVFLQMGSSVRIPFPGRRIELSRSEIKKGLGISIGRVLTLVFVVFHYCDDVRVLMF